MKMNRFPFAASVLMALAAFALVATPASARPRAVSKILGYVTAHSHDGNGSIRAPYRNTDVGYQVRLPRGTWVYCRTSCSETLRVNTVDVWANVDNATPIGVGTLQQECGVFGCLRWERSF
ncbi:hypothetical protein [Hyphomicrobium sulfonivorans]|nr:hypothetical protein [Hyphomicrobium sulfonivorans]